MAGESYEPDFPLEWGDAGAAFERRTGEPPGDAAVLHLGMPEVVRDADRKLYGAEPGSLGRAVTGADLATAVVGYAGLPETPAAATAGPGDAAPGADGTAPADAAEAGSASSDSAEGVEAPSGGGGAAALAVADRQGRVQGGAVSPDLLERAPASPYGARLDPDAVAGAARTALEQDGVVLVEDGDLARLDAYRPSMTADAYDDARDRALAEADDLVGRLTGLVDPERDLVVLVAPVSPGAAAGARSSSPPSPWPARPSSRAWPAAAPPAGPATSRCPTSPPRCSTTSTSTCPTP